MSDCTVPRCTWQNLYRGDDNGDDERELRDHIWHTHGGFGE